MTRDEFIESVLSFVDVKYMHQGRSRGAGVDCVGLPLAAAAECNSVGYFDMDHYSPFPDGELLEQGISRNCDLVSRENMQPGDVLLFAIGRRPQHVAVYVGKNRIVHAYSSIEKVSEHELADPWLKRLLAVYRPRFDKPKEPEVQP